MDLSLIEQRLKASLAGTARQVEGCAGLDAALRGVVTTPAVFVMPLDEKGYAMPTTGVVRQKLESLCGVVMCLENLRQASGGAAVVDLAVMRQAVRQALVGWVPDPANGEPMLFVGGELIQFNGDGRIWWSDEFVVTSYYRSP